MEASTWPAFSLIIAAFYASDACDRATYGLTIMQCMCTTRRTLLRERPYADTGYIYSPRVRDLVRECIRRYFR